MKSKLLKDLTHFELALVATGLLMNLRHRGVAGVQGSGWDPGGSRLPLFDRTVLFSELLKHGSPRLTEIITELAALHQVDVASWQWNPFQGYQPQ